jgi:hypothetical protein
MNTTELRELMNSADRIEHINPMRLDPKGSIKDRIMRAELITNGAYTYTEKQPDGAAVKVCVIGSV